VAVQWVIESLQAMCMPPLLLQKTPFTSSP
jgi:hypothetical protein